MSNQKLEDATWCYKIHGDHYDLTTWEGAEPTHGHCYDERYDESPLNTASEIGNDLLAANIERGLGVDEPAPVVRIWRRTCCTDWAYIEYKKGPPYWVGLQYGDWKCCGDWQIRFDVKPDCSAEEIVDGN